MRPKIIDATGPQGNAFVIMGEVRNYLQKMGRIDEWKAVREDMESGDYDHLCEVAERVSNLKIINRTT